MASRLRRCGVAIAATALMSCTAPAMQTLTASQHVSEDSIAAPLTADRDNVARGREVVTGRDGNCLLCHAIPETGGRFMGNLGPSLNGIGARLNEAQLRLRLVDPQRLNPGSIMPAYARTAGLTQVGKAWRGKPILSAQQIEDVVAFLATLR